MRTLTQLGFVSPQVRGLEAFRQFYADGLGFQPMAQSPPNACMLTTPSGASLAIPEPLGTLQAVARLGWDVGLERGVEDLSTFVQRLGSKVSLTRGTQASSFGNTAIMADPDGYCPTEQKLSRA